MKRLFVFVLMVAVLRAAALPLMVNAGGESLPVAPVYSDSTQWYISPRGGEVDIFYVISTETGDYDLDGVMRHYADTYNDSVRQPMLGEMQGVDDLLGGGFNFFSPYYRQCSLSSFTSDSLLARRLPVPMSDVRGAFDHYLTHFNAGRPFILAGFSQGAMIALQLLKEMDAATRERLVAAYIIGASITSEDLEQCPHLKPAQCATDVGVTICYNSVRDDSCAIGLFSRSVVAINPVNWLTDTTAAVLITEPSPLKPLAEQTCDTLTVRLDAVSHLLHVNGYTATDYVLPLIGKDGCYHSREIWLYRRSLRDNMKTRAAAFTIMAK